MEKYYLFVRSLNHRLGEQDKMEPSFPSAFGERCVSIILILEMAVRPWLHDPVNQSCTQGMIPAILLPFPLPFWKFFLGWQTKPSPGSRSFPRLSVHSNAFATHWTVLVWCLQGISLSHLASFHAMNQGLFELRFTSPLLSPCCPRLYSTLMAGRLGLILSTALTLPLASSSPMGRFL